MTDATYEPIGVDVEAASRAFYNDDDCWLHYSANSSFKRHLRISMTRALKAAHVRRQEAKAGAEGVGDG